MVKTLAESGLVKYEPYAGVRLTAVGREARRAGGAAAPADRAVSREGDGHELDRGARGSGTPGACGVGSADRSDRRDARAARGRIRTAIPIPDPDGVARAADRYDTLLTCPLHAPVTVQPRHRSGPRVPALRRAARSEAGRGRARSRSATPRPTACGCAAATSARSPSARAPRRRSSCRRAASRCSHPAARRLARRAQTARAGAAAPAAEAVRDHRQLVPRRGGVQPGARHLPEHLRRYAARAATGRRRSRRNGRRLAAAPALVHRWRRWTAATRVRLRRHAAELPLPGAEEGPGRPAFSPRVSLIVPTGDAARAAATGSCGLQVNLPFSKQRGDFYWHWNGGFTWLPRGEPRHGRSGRNLLSPFLAGSAIYRLRPMFNLMLEIAARLRRSRSTGRHVDADTVVHPVARRARRLERRRDTQLDPRRRRSRSRAATARPTAGVFALLLVRAAVQEVTQVRAQPS